MSLRPIAIARFAASAPLVLLGGALACGGGAPSAAEGSRPPRRSFYVSRLQPDVREAMPVVEAVDRLTRQGFECRQRESTRGTCCSGDRIVERVYVCNRPDGPSLAQVTFTDLDDQVHHLSSGGSLGIGGPDWREETRLRVPASPPDP